MTKEHYEMAMDRIIEILCKFEFEKVHNIMSQLDWTWGEWEGDDGEIHRNEVPSTYALKRKASSLMKRALEFERCVESGGLRVAFGDEESFFDDSMCYMGLSFVAVEI